MPQEYFNQRMYLLNQPWFIYNRIILTCRKVCWSESTSARSRSASSASSSWSASPPSSRLSSWWRKTRPIWSTSPQEGLKFFGCWFIDWLGRCEVDLRQVLTWHEQKIDMGWHHFQCRYLTSLCLATWIWQWNIATCISRYKKWLVFEEISAILTQNW